MRMLDVRRPIDPREHAGTAISVLGGAKMRTADHGRQVKGAADRLCVAPVPTGQSGLLIRACQRSALARAAYFQVGRRNRVQVELRELGGPAHDILWSHRVHDDGLDRMPEDRLPGGL